MTQLESALRQNNSNSVDDYDDDHAVFLARPVAAGEADHGVIFLRKRHQLNSIASIK